MDKVFEFVFEYFLYFSGVAVLWVFTFGSVKPEPLTEELGSFFNFREFVYQNNGVYHLSYGGVVCLGALFWSLLALVVYDQF